MTETKRQSGYFAQAWLVIALALGFSAALAGVDVALRDRIADNKRKATFGKIPELVPGATGGVAMEVDGYTVYRAMVGARQAGWVVRAAGQGYADRIELLVGLDARAETITGLAILDQKETPGLGDNIRTPEFRGRFAGKKTDRPLQPGSKTADNEIQAISGATISSGSVCTIINDAVAALREKLAAMAEPGL